MHVDKILFIGAKSKLVKEMLNFPQRQVYIIFLCDTNTWRRRTLSLQVDLRDKDALEEVFKTFR